MTDPAVEVYGDYRAPESAAAAVRAAFARLQQVLGQARPDLALRLLRQPELSDGAPTWMEIYRCERGVDAALEAHMEAAASVALGGVPIGSRHCERLIACVW